jgi:uncharacterized protein (TIGR02594 family)
MSHSIPSDCNKEWLAPWIDTAQREIGQKEVSGAKKANPRILEYFKASKFWGKDDTGGANAWCGSFIAWVMQQNGFNPPKDSFRAKEWLNFGQRLTKPAYGAIGVKTRAGGGHVAFIVGQSEDGSHYYMLGGNQGNSVKVSKYLASAWSGFVFPPASQPSDTLPIYDGIAEYARSEA